jgi:hypothetical protein
MGNTILTVTTDWIDGWKRMGVELERIENDPVGRVTRWTDYSVGVTGQCNYQRFLFSVRLPWPKGHGNTANYGWQLNTNRFNFHGVVGVSYLW